MPGDRHSRLDRQLLASQRRPIPRLKGKIVSSYQRGMDTREITGHRLDLYGVGLLRDPIDTAPDR